MKNIICIVLLLFSILAHAEEPELADHEWIHLLHDQPMYFLLGAPEAKVQLSLKAKVFKDQDIYMAYTQRIFWDLFQKSSPFRDISYNPSFFYRFHLKDTQEATLDFIPYEHESNGKDGAASRSWDRSGVRYQTMQHFSGEMIGKWSLRAWAPFNYYPTSRDIAQYRGIYEVIFTLSNFLGPYFDLNEVSLRIYPGGNAYINPLQGGRELTFRLKGKSDAFLANAVFQIFQGYGENLLEYKSSVWGFRAGIGI